MTETVQLEYRSQGEGTPLLVLHGLFGSGSNWGRQAARLAADGYQVILADLRNHGRSPHHADLHYPTMAADVLALLDRLRLDSALVLGHSMGGKVAMTLALEHGHRVRGLIVADVAPVTYEGDSHESLIEALQSVDLAALASRQAAFDQLAERIPEAGIRHFLLTNLEQRDGAWQWRVPLQRLRDGLPILRGFPAVADRNYPGPTLFLHGGDSDYLRAEHTSEVRKLFPDSHIVSLPECGHWLHVEDPDGFHAAVKQFLDSRIG